MRIHAAQFGRRFRFGAFTSSQGFQTKLSFCGRSWLTFCCRGGGEAAHRRSALDQVVRHRYGGHRLVRSAVEHHVLVSLSGVDACKRKGLLAKRCSALSGGARVARVGSFRLFVVISFAILDEPIIGSDALS